MTYKQNDRKRYFFDMDIEEELVVFVLTIVVE